MSYAIQVENLEKRYGAHVVLKGLSFTVNRGEIFALLGVNGAGKTTALECIEGLRAFDGGKVDVKGKIGIQLQSATLQSFIKPMEAVRLFAKWNRTEPDQDMLNALELNGFAKKKYADLSTGQKRRLHLALALAGSPDVVFLDEPTAGLDVEGRRSLHAQIRLLKERGKTIVLASHDMAEIEDLCDRIAILRDGRIAFLGTADELTETVGRRSTIQIKTNLGVESYDTENIADTLGWLLTEYREKGITVLDVKTDRGTLEQHFISIARGTGE